MKSAFRDFGASRGNLVLRLMALVLICFLHPQLHGANFAAAVDNPVVVLRESCGTPLNALVTAGTLGGNNAIDPGELVEARFALTNRSSVAWSALTLFLLNGNGVTQAQGNAFIPGPVAPGDRIEATFSFIPSGLAGDTVQPLVQIISGAQPLEQVPVPVRLGKVNVQSQSFSNPQPLVIPSLGAASVFPSSVTVPNTFGGALSSVRVRLLGLSHAHPTDVQVLLVSPGGQKILLMGGVGGETAAGPVDLTFDSSASLALTAATPLATGTYKPSSVPAGFGLPGPAPAPPYGSDLSLLVGSSPVGTWSLFAADASLIDSGSLGGGWILELSTSEIQSCNSPSNPVLSGVPAAVASVNEDEVFALPLTISDDTTPAADLLLSARSANQALVPDAGIRFVGTGSSRTMEVRAATNSFGVGVEAGAAITLRLQDKDGLFVERTFRLDVQPVNDLPGIAQVANVNLFPGQVSEPIEVFLSDPETPGSGLLLFASSSNQSVLADNAIQFTGTGSKRSMVLRPGADSNGFSVVSLSVLDGSGGVASTSFLVIVSPLNTAPELTVFSEQLITQAGSVSVPFRVFDKETPVELLAVTVASDNAALIPSTNLVVTGTGTNRVLTFTPQSGVSGVATITVVVKDSQEFTARSAFKVTVSLPPVPNFPPRLTPPVNQSVFAGQTLKMGLDGSDLETPIESLKYSADSDSSSLLPEGSLQFVFEGGRWYLNVSPAFGTFGKALVRLRLADAAGAFIASSFVVEVLDFNDPPEITDFGQLELESGAVSRPIPFNVADSETPLDQLTVVASIADAALATLKVTGKGFDRQLIVEARPGASGQSRITVTVTDAGGKSSSKRFDLRVFPPKVVQPPQLSVSRNGELIEITWPESATGFRLESKESLSATQWNAVSAPTSVSVGAYRVQLPVAAGARFFRLNFNQVP